MGKEWIRLIIDENQRDCEGDNIYFKAKMNMPNYNLQRFLDAQQSDYEQALTESGKRAEIFPLGLDIFLQLKGFGYEVITPQYYGISRSRRRQKAYLPIRFLGDREITSVFLQLKK